ncbi:MAG TPA: cytochrome c biogenesis protein CcsA [Gemmataceae bacterium]|jgi:hypothetical protein|nr:cytochrome c biogenesis protein CcsA [Gemmataceae bacterium]
MLEWQQHIVSWRRALADKIGPDANTLDELESHVRDEMDRLVREGQAPEHAVLAAIAKIGTAEKLAMEFAKVARPWWPIRFVLAGAFLSITAFLVALLVIISQAMRGRWDGLLLTHVATITVGYLFTYGIGVLALCLALRRTVQDLSIGQKTSWIRAVAGLTLFAFVLTLMGTILGAVWAKSDVRWGRLWGWDLKEIGALMTLAWQAILLVILWSRLARSRWLLCWGMLGDVIVTFAWFVSNVMISDGQLPAYGYSRDLILTFFYVILGTHVLLMAAALAPSGWLRIRKIAG